MLVGQHRSMLDCSAVVSVEITGSMEITEHPRGRSSWLFKLAKERPIGRGLLLWIIGVPIPIILLIWAAAGAPEKPQPEGSLRTEVSNAENAGVDSTFPDAPN
jgi:hypothetical protein